MPEQLLVTAEAGLARARAALGIHGRRVDGTALARHLAAVCLALRNLLLAEGAATEREDQTAGIMQAVRDIARDWSPTGIRQFVPIRCRGR